MVSVLNNSEYPANDDDVKTQRMRKEKDPLGNILQLRSYKSDEILIKKKKKYYRTFSVHGLTRICTGTKTESIFWIFILLLGLSVTVLFVYRLVGKYLKYEIYTEMSEVVTLKNAFPAITFCDYKMIIAGYFAYCGNYGGKKYAKSNSPCNIPDIQRNISDIQRRRRNDTNNVRLQEEQKKKWRNQYYLVTKCHSWGGKLCESDKHLRSLDRHNHACFTWNYNGTFYDAYSHAYLQFEVNETFFEKHSYVVALVHDPRIEELDMTNRVILEPSKTYELRIAKTVVKRLPAPYPSNCTVGKSHDLFPGKYTPRTCMESLLYLKMFKKCGDVLDYHKQYIPVDFKNKYGRNDSIETVIECIYGFKDEQYDTSEKCALPCEELELWTMSSFHNLHGKYDGNKLIYRVNIQYHNVDSYKIMEEKMLFSWDQVIGEVGGLLGLVIGASFISLIEIVAYLFWSCVDKIKSRFRNNKDDL